MLSSGQISQMAMSGFGMAPPAAPTLMAALSANPLTQQGFMTMNQLGPAVANALISPQTPILGAFTQGAMNRSSFMGALNQVAFPGGMGPMGMGFGAGQRESIFQYARGMAGQQGMPNLSELSQIVGMGAAGGEFQAVRTVEDFKKRFSELVRTVKTVTTALGTSIQEAMQLMQSMGQMGFSGAAGPGMLSRIQQNAFAAGVSPQAMMQGMGAMIPSLRQAGGMGQSQAATTAMGFMGTLGTAYSMGILTDQQLQFSTGQTGGAGIEALMGSYLPRAAQRMRRGGRGSYLTAAMLDPETGQIDPGMIGQLMSGTLGVEGVQREAGRRAGQYGQANWMLNRGRLGGQVMEATGGMGEMMFYRNVLRQRGMGDLNDPRARITLGRLMGASQEEVESFLPIMQNLDQIQTMQMVRGAQQRVGQGNAQMRGILQQPDWLKGIQTRMQGLMGKLERTGEDMAASLERAITAKFDSIVGRYEGWLDDANVGKLFGAGGGAGGLQQMGRVAQGVFAGNYGGGAPGQVQRGATLEQTAGAMRANWMGQAAYYAPGATGSVGQAVQGGLAAFNRMGIGAQADVLRRMQLVQGVAAPMAAGFLQAGQGQVGQLASTENWMRMGQQASGLWSEMEAGGDRASAARNRLGAILRQGMGGMGDITNFTDRFKGTAAATGGQMGVQELAMFGGGKPGEFLYQSGDVTVNIGGREVTLSQARMRQLGRGVSAGGGMVGTRSGRMVTNEQVMEAAYSALAEQDPSIKKALQAAEGGFGGLGLGMLDVLQGGNILAAGFTDKSSRAQQATALASFERAMGGKFGIGERGLSEFIQRNRGAMGAIVGGIDKLSAMAGDQAVVDRARDDAINSIRRVDPGFKAGSDANSSIFMQMLSDKMGKELDPALIQQIASDPAMKEMLSKGNFKDAMGLLVASGQLDQGAQYHELGKLSAQMLGVNAAAVEGMLSDPKVTSDPAMRGLLQTLKGITTQDTMDPAQFGTKFREIMSTVLMDPSKMDERVRQLGQAGWAGMPMAGVTVGLMEQFGSQQARGRGGRRDILRQLAGQLGVTGGEKMGEGELAKAIAAASGGKVSEADITSWAGKGGAGKWQQEVAMQAGLKAGEGALAQQAAAKEQAAAQAKAQEDAVKNGFLAAITSVGEVPVKMANISLTGTIGDQQVKLGMGQAESAAGEGGAAGGGGG